METRNGYPEYHMIMSTFREKEKYCQHSFEAGGSYWHLYTSGKKIPLAFKTINDFVFAMNVTAQIAIEYQDIRIITFEIMGNPMHILSEGARESFLEAFAFLRKRLARGLKDSFPDGLPEGFSPEIKEIRGLDAMRNTIVYVNRNGFVADRRVILKVPGRVSSVRSMSLEHDSWIQLSKSAVMFRGRVPKIPSEWPIEAGYVLPSAYCAVKFAKDLFRDAHHYFSMLCKNVEAYSGIAVEIGDEEYPNDSELFSKIKSVITGGTTRLRSVV